VGSGIAVAAIAILAWRKRRARPRDARGTTMTDGRHWRSCGRRAGAGDQQCHRCGHDPGYGWKQWTCSASATVFEWIMQGDIDHGDPARHRRGEPDFTSAAAPTSASRAPQSHEGSQAILDNAVLGVVRLNVSQLITIGVTIQPIPP